MFLSRRTLSLVLAFSLITFVGGCSGYKKNLTAIAVTPANPSIALGLTQQFTATGTYSDSTTADVTSQVTWGSASTTVATISSSGLATSVATGSSVISATLGTVSGQTKLTVTPAVLASVRVTPATPSIAVGQTAVFTAVGVLTDGTTQPLVGPVTWASGTTATATIAAPNTSGIALAIAAGTSTITATDAASTKTGNTVLTVVAATSRFAFAASLTDSSVATYVVNPTTGAFTPRGKTYVFGFPATVVPEPSGRFIYLPRRDAKISIFSVNPITGSLADTGLPPANNLGVSSPLQGVVDPTGRHLYVANSNAGSISAYSINTSTGALTPIAGSPFAAGTAPTSVVLDRTGQFLYASDNGGTAVFEFKIDAAGALTPLSTPSVVSGTAPGFMIIDPSNNFLYVPNGGNGINPGSVSVFSIGTGINAGLLTPVSGSPFSTGIGISPSAVAVDPSNKFAFVANAGDGVTPGSVSVLNITTGGVLGAAVTGSPFAADIFPTHVVVDPAGKYVVATNDSSNDLTFYTLNSSTGGLTLAGNLESGITPVVTSLYLATAVPAVSPAAAAAANATTGDISGYKVTSSSGALTAATGSPFAGISGNTLLSADPAGRVVMTVSPTAKQVASFLLDSTAGTVSGLSTASFGLSVPGNLYTESTGQYVYVAETTVGSIVGFFRNPSGPSLTATGLNDSTPGLNSVAGDPAGNAVYGLGLNTIYSAAINPVTGGISAGVTNALAGNWISGATAPSGRYLAALNATTHTLQSFKLAPMQSLTPTLGSPDGTATFVSSAPAGANSATVTFDALGRFVFVTDTTAKTIAVFTFNPTTGVLGSTPAFTTPALSGTPGQVSVDATGNFLYVAVQGASPTTAGSVAAFTITVSGSTVSLSAVTGSPFPANQGTSGVLVLDKVN